MKVKIAKEILEYFKDEIKDKPCSVSHHLNVKGGLIKHLMNTYKAAKEIDPLNEQLHALALVHDIGKARTYTKKIKYTKPMVDHLINTVVMITEAGYKLSQEELHALQFHHGGWSPFAKNANLTELAVKLHAADMIATVREDNE